MKLAKTSGTLGLAVLAAIASPLAMAAAAERGGYIGFNVGRSQAHIDEAGIVGGLQGAGFGTTSIATDDRDRGFKFYGGYRFSRHFAVEGGYVDLGEFGFTAAGTAGTLTGELQARGGNIDAVGILPITDQLSVFGRAGLTYLKSRGAFSGTGAVVVLNPSPSEREASYKYGVGLQYDFTERLGIRAEAERYRVNDSVGGKADIDLFSVGLVWRFGVKAPVPPPPRAEPAPPPPPRPAPPPPAPKAPPPPPKAVVTPPPPPPPPAPVEKPVRRDRN